MTSNLKIFGSFFACSILLGKATNYFNAILPYLKKQKSYACGPNVSYFASMIEVNFTRLSKLEK